MLVLSAEGKLLSKPQISKEELAGGAQSGPLFARTKDAPAAVEGVRLAFWLVPDPAGKRVAFPHREEGAIEIRILEGATLETETVRKLPAKSRIHDFGCPPGRISCAP
ncbi:MAG: hypothetical protein HYY18_18685 [Planctomycetes bacterium]|nr:hypothetical protein [Planctomycetota bacterium]